MTKSRPPIGGLSIKMVIHLCGVLDDIKSKRTKLSPVSLDDIRTLIEIGLEIRDEGLVLTDKGHRLLD